MPVPPPPPPASSLDASPPSPGQVAATVAALRQHQTAALTWFARARLDLAPARYPGLFAEIDTLNGRVRPIHEQRVWTWGDCRALGLWSSLLVKDVVPDLPVSRAVPSLRAYLGQYCDDLHHHLLDRLAKHHGRFPFIADPATNRATDDPRNRPGQPGEYEPSHVFAAAAFLQYGLLRSHDETLRLGEQFLHECLECGLAYRNIDHLTGQRLPHRGHGFVMITLGAIVDTLKTLTYLSLDRQANFPGLRDRLVAAGRVVADLLTRHFFNPVTGACWEYLDLHDAPLVQANGVLLCDPGHSAEALGFMAELEAIAPTSSAAVAWMPRALAFINRYGYSPVGVMFKHLDASTGQGLPDRHDAAGRPFRTAPWWNLRECAAASLRLYVHTRNEACLHSYHRACRASQQFYPTPWCTDILLQTLDADTGLPLPFHPATGNIDPLHDARATEREIEAWHDLTPFPSTQS